MPLLMEDETGMTHGCRDVGQLVCTFPPELTDKTTPLST